MPPFQLSPMASDSYHIMLIEILQLLLPLDIIHSKLYIGLVVGSLQSMTGIHDQTVSFVPKVLLTIVAIALALPWLSQRMVDYTRDTLDRPIIQLPSESNSYLE